MNTIEAKTPPSPSVGSDVGLGVWKIDRFGKWWRGRLSLTRGLWRIGLTQDFGSCQVGLSFWQRAGQLTLGFWSLDVARLMRFEMPAMEPRGLDMSDILAELRKDPPSPPNIDSAT